MMVSHSFLCVAAMGRRNMVNVTTGVLDTLPTGVTSTAVDSVLPETKYSGYHGSVHKDYLVRTVAPMGHVTLVAIARTIILVSYHYH